MHPILFLLVGAIALLHREETHAEISQNGGDRSSDGGDHQQSETPTTVDREGGITPHPDHSITPTQVKPNELEPDTGDHRGVDGTGSQHDSTETDGTAEPVSDPESLPTPEEK